MCSQQSLSITIINKTICESLETEWSFYLDKICSSAWVWSPRVLLICALLIFNIPEMRKIHTWAHVISILKRFCLKGLEVARIQLSS